MTQPAATPALAAPSTDPATPAQTGQEPATAAAVQATNTGPQSAQQGSEGDVASLPDWAQKLLRDARADAGKARTTAKQTAADEARQELAQQIGKALGLVQDDQPADPAKLTEQLAARQASERDALVRLAVFETATEHGGNPSALTDSRTFLAKVAQLDPTAADFSAQVAAAATEAVGTNPALKAAQAASTPAGGVEFTGGATGGPARTYTRAQLRDSKFFADNKADIMAAMREGRIKE